MAIPKWAPIPWHWPIGFSLWPGSGHNPFRHDILTRPCRSNNESSYLAGLELRREGVRRHKHCFDFWILRVWWYHPLRKVKTHGSNE